jgi:hypothetical protein
MIRLIAFSLSFFIFFISPVLASPQQFTINPPPNSMGSREFPYYESSDGVYHYGGYFYQSASSIVYGSPIKLCLYGHLNYQFVIEDKVWTQYFPTTITRNPPYLSPDAYSRPDYPPAASVIIYSCEIWVYPVIRGSSSSDSNSCDSSGALSQVSSSVFDRAVAFLPDVPPSMRISSVLSNLFGGSSLAGYLVSQIWLEISPLLLVFVGLKLYKLLPFV